MINLTGAIGDVKLKTSGEIEFKVSAIKSHELMEFLLDNCSETIGMQLEAAQLTLPGIDASNENQEDVLRTFRSANK